MDQLLELICQYDEDGEIRKPKRTKTRKTEDDGEGDVAMTGFDELEEFVGDKKDQANKRKMPKSDGKPKKFNTDSVGPTVQKPKAKEPKVEESVSKSKGDDNSTKKKPAKQNADSEKRNQGKIPAKKSPEKDGAKETPRQAKGLGKNSTPEKSQPEAQQDKTKGKQQTPEKSQDKTKGKQQTPEKSQDKTKGKQPTPEKSKQGKPQTKVPEKPRQNPGTGKAKTQQQTAKKQAVTKKVDKSQFTVYVTFFFC